MCVLGSALLHVRFARTITDGLQLSDSSLRRAHLEVMLMRDENLEAYKEPARSLHGACKEPLRSLVGLQLRDSNLRHSHLAEAMPMTNENLRAYQEPIRSL